MRRNPGFFRLTASVALITLLWDTILPPAAVAQPAPPPLPLPYQAQPVQAQPNLAQADPPARVGRIAWISGTVSFHTEGDTQWSSAAVNYPVSSGNAVWTEPSATTELEISNSRIVLAGTTEFDIATLDSNGLQAVAAQGEAYLHLRDVPAAEAWSVQTPRGLVRLSGAGRYDIVVGTTEQPTLVTVVDGAAEIEGPGVSLRVASGQTATITGTDSFQGSIGSALYDPFLTAQQAAERPRPTAPIPAPVAIMPGGSDLAGYGDWAQAPEYGQVWYPPVAAGWVPYREGHWAYIAPWGWTWIDDAPWGFAPFHYGRWVEIGSRWAWSPGDFADAGPPVYAPALVAFIGIGLAAHSIGWIPLGPHEPFRPWFHASDRYVRGVNLGRATNNNMPIDRYRNRGAATAIPVAAMAGSRPVRSFARHLTAQQITTARPIVGQQPVRPTAGIPSSGARQVNPGPAVGLRSAPGPAFHTPPVGAGLARPGVAPFAMPTIPGPITRSEPRPLPRVVTPQTFNRSNQEPRREAPLGPRPEPFRGGPGGMPSGPPGGPPGGPQRFAPPMPRAEPQRFAPPAARAEPTHPAARAAPERQKRPGER